LLAALAAAGVTVAAWDLTSDVGVPVCAATLVEDPAEPAWRSLGVYQGFGCHLDPEVALVRAVLEAVQTRVTYIAGSRDDFFPFDYERASDPEMVEAVWAHVHRRGARMVDVGALPRRVTPTFEGDVAVLVEALAAAGAGEVVVVDLTQERWKVPVVKVLVPGRATDVARMG
jgi:ribosomal protein S12 methylthiotransferase accessory factor